MGVTLKDGKISVGGSYGLKVNMGDYSSQSLDQWLTLEYAVPEGVDAAAAVAQAEAEFDGLLNHIKTAVFSGLGVEGKFDEGGVLQPVLPTPAPTVKQNFTKPQSNGGGQRPAPYGGGGGGQYGNKPSVYTDDLPRFQADLDGTGVTEWIDCRPAKADGRYSEKAPDFRKASRKTDATWLRDRQGNISAAVAQALQVAGLPL